MTEATAIIRELDWAPDQVGVCLGALPATLVDWRPPTAEANDAPTIVSHILGATRAYALGLGFGQPVGRDRIAEFDASGLDRATLLGALGRLRDELHLAASGPVDLGAPVVIPGGWVGPAAEGDRRDALLEALRHASIHLGELRVVRDLAIAPPPAAQ